MIDAELMSAPWGTCSDPPFRVCSLCVCRGGRAQNHRSVSVRCVCVPWGMCSESVRIGVCAVGSRASAAGRPGYFLGRPGYFWGRSGYFWGRPGYFCVRGGEPCPGSPFRLCPLCVRWGAVPRITVPCVSGECAGGSRAQNPVSVYVRCGPELSPSRVRVSRTTHG